MGQLPSPWPLKYVTSRYDFPVEGKAQSTKEGKVCAAFYSVGISADLRLALQANTLLADHIFSPSLLLAERIERGLLPVSGKNSKSLSSITHLDND